MYDYIIIGAGSAGCVLANRLSADESNRVLLVEAGPKNDSIWTKMPMGVAQLLNNSKVAWLTKTNTGEHFNNRELTLTQGKMLGGSSSLNGHVYTRGHKDNYDEWAADGCEGWSWEEVLPYFKKSECFPEGDPEVHGHSGELRTNVYRKVHFLTQDVLDAAKNAGIPFSSDTSSANEEGFGYTHIAIHKGVRQSAYVAFLKPVMGRPNLTVRPNTYVHKIVFDENKVAIGVDLGEEVVKCSKEVILSAGAIASPQILQHSGIGEEAHLESLGIEVIQHAPNVGQNLQDHLFAHLKYKLDDKNASMNKVFANPLKTVGALFNWIFKKEGPMAMPASALVGFLRSDDSQTRPDVQVAMLPFYYEISPEDGQLTFPKTAGFTLSAMNVSPKSKGEVKIASNNPLEKATVHLNYLSADEDIERLRNLVRKLRGVVQQQPVAKYGVTEVKPGPEIDSDADLEAYFRQTCETIYHPIGTCRMGSDETAVVDPQLRVKGVTGLRVIDASIMPTITTGNTNAPTYMIAEKGADMVLADAEKDVEI